MNFYINEKHNYDNGLYVFLKSDNWNDYGYITMFSAYLYKSSKMIEELGNIKIAFLGEKNGIQSEKNNVNHYIAKKFSKLDNNFCSLWQSLESYKKVKNSEKEYGINIFSSLNDIVVQIDKLNELLQNDMVSTSLFRFISPFECENQFYRVYIGKEPLDNYEYSFIYADKDKNSDNTLVFEVNVESCPPTNIHVLIGSNGCGKTYTIKEIVTQFIRADIADKKFESIFLISFNPFDDYSTFYNVKNSDISHIKKDFYYIGARNINDLNKNKDVNELTQQFIENYYACCKNEKKILEWNSFINDMSNTFPNAKYINELIILNDFYKKSSNISTIFNLLSAGYKEVVSIVCGTIATMVEKSLIIMDEPENHLHPPLLSMLIRWLSNILVERNAFSIIATHSPIILQEVPKSCVWIIQRFGNVRKVYRPTIETFGTNLSTLTYEVFKYEIENSGFNTLLKKVANESQNYEDALRKFGGCLGDEAKSRLRLLCYKEDKNEKN
ncbi:MAG: AAA family ATPase [Acholeplasmatales bacterium]|nr:AAA family ATPase [Acholeplasmatales bacterium]